MIKGLKLSCNKRLRKMGRCSLETRNLGEDFIRVHKYLKGGCKEDRPRLFSVMDKLEHGRFCLNIRKHCLPARVSEHWHKLPREVVESPPWR